MLVVQVASLAVTIPCDIHVETVLELLRFQELLNLVFGEEVVIVVLMIGPADVQRPAVKLFCSELLGSAWPQHPCKHVIWLCLVGAAIGLLMSLLMAVLALQIVHAG